MSPLILLTETQIHNKNLNQIKLNISKYSPHPKKVKIIAITKTFSFSAIESAEKQKIFNIGESKIQETNQKLKNKTTNIKTKLHLIGHLQSNKVKLAVNTYNVIQSTDSIKILNKINNSAKKINKKQKIFLQLNISNNPSQKGFTVENIMSAAEHVEQLAYVKLIGLMSIGEKTTNKNKIEKGFRYVEEIRNKIVKKISPTCINLSLGMSQDYVLALKAGSTHLRLGTILFTKRNG
tara:strand:+ start:423 stop:1130 length:708 start_codon:yes stop_codon:yes gene_type:complete